MKIDRLETHDRLEHFRKQSFDIAECCQDLINQQPFGLTPFYIFAHARTDDDGVTKRLIWQPRLSKPTAQINSMLFKVYPPSDNIKIIWMIPARELWEQFQKGKMTESEIVWNSIQDFIHNKDRLEAPEPDDLTDSQMAHLYEILSKKAELEKFTKNLQNPQKPFVPLIRT